jgi:SAM-dependent methyltransferase
VAWLEGASPVLVIDGGDVAGAIPGATVLRHETSGAPGLPFHFPDPRRLPAKDGAYRAVVLSDVLDKVIDHGAALDEVLRVLAPGGRLVVAQTLAPDDFEERAVWNAIAKMREPRHASSPSSRQVAAMVSGLGLTVLKEAAWEEACDPTVTARSAEAMRLATMLDAAVARGSDHVIRDGKLVLSRRAWLLGKAPA